MVRHNNAQLPALMGHTFETTHFDFDTHKVYAEFKKATSVMDKHGKAIREVEIFIGGRGRNPIERELHDRLKSEDFACIRVPNGDAIYILFPDMSLYPAEARNVSAPFGHVYSKKVLHSQADVKALFAKYNIDYTPEICTQAHSGFDKQKVFAAYKKAESITDSERCSAKEAKYQAYTDATYGKKPLATELNTRLNSEDFACMDEMTDYSRHIYVLFPDMTVYFVEGRTSAEPYGGVHSKKVLRTQADVRALFDKLDIENILRTAQAQKKTSWWARVRG